jgi:hypothetical protein
VVANSNQRRIAAISPIARSFSARFASHVARRRDLVPRTTATVMAFARDSEPYLVPSEALADLPAAVPFVPNDAIWAPRGPTRPASLHGSTCHKLVTHAGFVSLARRQEEGPALATTARAHMHCDAESTLAPPERFDRGVPFLVPAACGCARTVVPSTSCTAQSILPSASAWVCTTAKMRSPIPALCHRSKRLATVDQGP